MKLRWDWGNWQVGFKVFTINRDHGWSGQSFLKISLLCFIMVFQWEVLYDRI